jgi:hypothetical protein
MHTQHIFEAHQPIGKPMAKCIIKHWKGFFCTLHRSYAVRIEMCDARHQEVQSDRPLIRALHGPRHSITLHEAPSSASFARRMVRTLRSWMHGIS